MTYPMPLTRRVLLGLMAAVAAAPAMAQDAAAPEVSDFSLGDPSAPVKIVEYASYTCPHCAAFHAEAFDKLKADYIDTGKVHFTLREVYFDRYGLWAAMVARCGGDMRYFPIHSQLFAKQQEWLASQEPNDVIAALKTIGRAAGMEDAAMDTCLNDAPMAEALVTRFQENMEKDGVEGTPTLFINGTKHSNMAYDELKALIETELAA
jgi:protein-disulfide isomerase